MAYKVTRNILDSKDNLYFYEAGETFPREGLVVSDNRLKALLELGVIASDTPSQEVKEVELSVKELKAKLDELGIDYKSRATKEELKALLDAAKGG